MTLTTIAMLRPHLTPENYEGLLSAARHVKREVWARDQGQCAFIGSLGRCIETSRLEFHHVTPFALGGATDVANISLRCRAHNSFESERVFGPWLPDVSQTTRSGPS